VLNQELYTLYADPLYIKHPTQVAKKIASVVGGSKSNYASLMAIKDTQYVILATKITSSQSSKILSLQIPGIGTQGQGYRTYPQGSLASQVLN
jgi:cell division protein FtsI/penicillin-binding protein 2